MKSEMQGFRRRCKPLSAISAQIIGTRLPGATRWPGPRRKPQRQIAMSNADRHSKQWKEECDQWSTWPKRNGLCNVCDCQERRRTLLIPGTARAQMQEQPQKWAEPQGSCGARVTSVINKVHGWPQETGPGQGTRSAQNSATETKNLLAATTVKSG